MSALAEPIARAAVSSWPAVEADLRRALAQRAHSTAAIDLVVAELRPIFAGVERARARGIDPEILWALVGVAADKARRRAQAERTRPVGVS